MQYHLSRVCAGDLVTTRWKVPEDESGQPVHFDTLGDFGYHATRSAALPGIVRSIWNGAYALWQGLRLSRRNGAYDVVVAYGPFTLAVVGWILKARTGAKLVVEVPGPPTEGFVFDGGLLGATKLRVARRLVPFLLRRADGTRLYYSWQLDDLPSGPRPPAFVFPDFVPVRLIPEPAPAAADTDERYILFLGYPFNRKGVDVLVKAFNIVAREHPDVVLRIVGYCPDVAPWQRLVEAHAKVRFERPRPHAEAMEILAKCSIFALPSRMEGVPRVIIEALAAKRPVVSTRASGIPALIEHERTGLLSEVDDVDQLAANIDRLLREPAFARELAENGYRKVMEELTEEQFVANFEAMMRALCGEP